MVAFLSLADKPNEDLPLSAHAAWMAECNFSPPLPPPLSSPSQCAALPLEVLITEGQIRLVPNAQFLMGSCLPVCPFQVVIVISGLHGEDPLLPRGPGEL